METPQTINIGFLCHRQNWPDNINKPQTKPLNQTSAFEKADRTVHGKQMEYQIARFTIKMWEILTKIKIHYSVERFSAKTDLRQIISKVILMCRVNSVTHDEEREETIISEIACPMQSLSLSL